MVFNTLKIEKNNRFQNKSNKLPDPKLLVLSVVYAKRLYFVTFSDRNEKSNIDISEKYLQQANVFYP